MRRVKYEIAARLMPVALLLGAGCARHEVRVQPQPVFEVPATFSIPPGSEPRAPERWWTAFDDPHLDALVEQALQGNLTLAQAVSRIDQATAIQRQVRALRRPEVSVSGDVERRWTRDLDPPQREPNRGVDVTFPTTTDGQLDSGRGSGSGSTSLNEDEPDREQWETEASLGLDLRWELDLWGRVRALTRAENEELAATGFDYEALRLSLSSQVAFAYYEAVEQRLQLALLDEQLELAGTFLELLELRFVQGDASGVDLLQQQSQIAEIETEIPVAQAQLRLLENRLDALLGHPPDGEDRTADALHALDHPLATPTLGVPAALLQHRPDLRALQRRVVAQDHRIAAAMAERLPQIVLDGSFGLRDSSDTSLLAASGALGLFQPLLDWGRREAQVTVERARFEEALLDYSQAYLAAIEDVENTMWQEARQRDLIEALVAREELLRRTVEETRVRYSLGVTDYLPVLTALQDLQQVQRRLVEERRVLATLRVSLFRALGGATGVRDDAHGHVANAAAASDVPSMK